MSTKGRLFEKFVEYTLVSVGFFSVPVDGLFVFAGSAGKMIQGLGNPHNADVLVEPPFQTPFYWQSRLLVECKDYKTKIGIDVLRNVMGIREDINHFEVIDESILKRRISRHTKPAVMDFDRYLYQVAIASSSGFTINAQEFAMAHRINLLTFHDFPMFVKLMDTFNRLRSSKLINTSTNNLMNQVMDNTNGLTIGQYSKNISVAVTSNGLLIFLYAEQKHDPLYTNLAKEDFSLHFYKHAEKIWYLNTIDKTFSFTLPRIYQDYWKKSLEADKTFQPIQIKEQFFQSIILMTNDNRPVYLTLSKKLIEEKKTVILMS